MKNCITKKYVNHCTLSPLSAAAEEEEPPKKKKKKKSSSKKKQVKKVIKPASTSKAATAANEDKQKDLSEAILGLSKNSNTMKVRRSFSKYNTTFIFIHHNEKGRQK